MKAENTMLRIAMISYHTCPLATLGGKDTGGMNVYVRDLTRQLGCLGIHVDVFTRSQDEHVPHVLHNLGYGNRVVHVPAGPEIPVPKSELVDYIPEFVEGSSNLPRKKASSMMSSTATTGCPGLRPPLFRMLGAGLRFCTCSTPWAR